jgi:hypothetical protein
VGLINVLLSLISLWFRVREEGKELTSILKFLGRGLRQYLSNLVPTFLLAVIATRTVLTSHA